jgi:hypothetical protein
MEAVSNPTLTFTDMWESIIKYNPERGGGRAHSPAGEGLAETNSDNWRKSLALCLLCGLYCL